jgi:hypothetical protein
MKRRDLIKRIGTAAKAADLTWDILREGANHTVYVLDQLRIPIPRHNEINEITALGIMKDCADKLGEDWWK